MTDYFKKQEALAKQARLKYKNAVKYYYYEWVPHYGFRQMGRTDGYNSLSELKRDQEFSFRNQKERGYPIFIMKSKVIQVV